MDCLIDFCDAKLVKDFGKTNQPVCFFTKKRLLLRYPVVFNYRNL